MIGKLLVTRHHESEWNKLGKWTGVVDVHLSPLGFEGSRKMGELLKNYKIDYIFTSTQSRAKETLNEMLGAMNNNKNIPTEEARELNERDYGNYTGKNKWDIEKELGHDQFVTLRRGWNTPIPNGESLKMVYERSVPFFINNILSILKKDKNVLIVAHGNSIRSIIKYIENIGNEEISKVEMPFGDIIIYDLDKDGHMLDKKVLR